MVSEDFFKFFPIIRKLITDPQGTMIQAEIHHLFQGRACTIFGQALKLQSTVVTLNIRSSS